MHDANRQFVDLANPHAWWLTARNLHDQALQLYARCGKSYVTLTDADGRVQGQWDDISKSVYLLGGLALENLIKAFLVYEHPEWISNGTLARPLRSHKLTELQERSARLPRHDDDQQVLSSFEEGLDSWARYPCGLSIETSEPEPSLGPVLWLGYLRLVKKYDHEMKKLLGTLWRGPHGFVGKYTFSGEWP
jgi:hypothetical protein